MLKSLLKNVQRSEIDFSALKKPRKPNSYLMCPKDYCLYAPKHESPVFDMDAAELAAAFEKVALSEPRAEKISERELGGGKQMDFVQYSALIGYPDTITVQFIALEGGKSTLAVFCRAHYGYRDFGVNEARIKDWVGKLQAAL